MGHSPDLSVVSFLSLQEIFQVFTCDCDASSRLVIYSFYNIEIYFYYTLIVDRFNYEILHVSNVFLHWWDDHMIFICYSVATFVNLHMLKHFPLSGINPTWSWCMIILMCCWIPFASILLRIFASMFIRDTFQPAVYFFSHSFHTSCSLLKENCLHCMPSFSLTKPGWCWEPSESSALNCSSLWDFS